MRHRGGVTPPRLLLFGKFFRLVGLYCLFGKEIALQASAGEFAALFAQAARNADGIVGIFISTELSGTVASALAARESLPDLPIEVVDSRSTTMGLGFVALAAGRAAAEGRGLAEVAAAARELVPRVNVLFIVETLEYLHRGGRIGGASRLLGSALRIKPLLHLNEGRIDALDGCTPSGRQ